MYILIQAAFGNLKHMGTSIGFCDSNMMSSSELITWWCSRGVAQGTFVLGANLILTETSTTLFLVDLAMQIYGKFDVW